MRTSRVSSTTSSIFRNEQQYLHAGDLSHNFGQNPKKQFKNSLLKNKDKKHLSNNKQIQQQRPNKVAASFVDNAYDLQIRNGLNETAVKLSLVSKQKKFLNSYRSSI
ncbi:NAD synthetase [Lysinibacillus sp. NPDC056959]|uniref:NAD synthetase n=1 Tax=Lysinibacillus sp. NPDC056959 TaxID=3345981 RepID=UPI0036386F0D